MKPFIFPTQQNLEHYPHKIADGKKVFFMSKTNHPPIKLIDKVYKKLGDDRKIPIVFETKQQYVKDYIHNQEVKKKYKFPSFQKEQFMNEELGRMRPVVARYTTKHNRYIEPRVVYFTDGSINWNKNPKTFEETARHEFYHEWLERKGKKMPRIQEERKAENFALDNTSLNKTMPYNTLPQFLREGLGITNSASVRPLNFVSNIVQASQKGVEHFWPKFNAPALSLRSDIGVNRARWKETKWQKPIDESKKTVLVLLEKKKPIEQPIDITVGLTKLFPSSKHILRQEDLREKLRDVDARYYQTRPELYKKRAIRAREQAKKRKDEEWRKIALQEELWKKKIAGNMHKNTEESDDEESMNYTDWNYFIKPKQEVYSNDGYNRMLSDVPPMNLFTKAKHWITNVNPKFVCDECNKPGKIFRAINESGEHIGDFHSECYLK